MDNNKEKMATPLLRLSSIIGSQSDDEHIVEQSRQNSIVNSVCADSCIAK